LEDISIPLATPQKMSFAFPAFLLMEFTRI